MGSFSSEWRFGKKFQGRSVLIWDGLHDGNILVSTVQTLVMVRAPAPREHLLFT